MDAEEVRFRGDPDKFEKLLLMRRPDAFLPKRISAEHQNDAHRGALVIVDMMFVKGRCMSGCADDAMDMRVDIRSGLSKASSPAVPVFSQLLMACIRILTRSEAS